jgi:hypothetical protein
MKSPVQKLTLDEIEQRAAYEIACGDVGSTVQYPVTAYQVLEALQVSCISMLFCYLCLHPQLKMGIEAQGFDPNGWFHLF